MKLASDKYGFMFHGDYSAIPSADQMPDECVYVCTDDAHKGWMAIKPGKGMGWVWVRAYNEGEFAPTPHGNEHHDPDFALLGHTHPLAELEGIIAKGALIIADHPGSDVPTGSPIHEQFLPDLAIDGTTARIVALHAKVYVPPTSSISFVFKLDGAMLETVTIAGGATKKLVTLPTPKPVSGYEKLTIDGPANAYGAKGMVLMVLLDRVVG